MIYVLPLIPFLATLAFYLKHKNAKDTVNFFILYTLAYAGLLSLIVLISEVIRYLLK